MRDMTDEGAGAEVHHGLEGVVAFETQIAEPDKEGSALRYRGVDIEDIVGRVPFENVWGLLIDGAYTPGLAPAEPYNLPVHTGDVRVEPASRIGYVVQDGALFPHLTIARNATLPARAAGWRDHEQTTRVALLAELVQR